jgi:hypothetical protein
LSLPVVSSSSSSSSSQDNPLEPMAAEHIHAIHPADLLGDNHPLHVRQQDTRIKYNPKDMQCILANK